MPAVLYAIPASHPCAAVQRALELKDVPFRRVELIPVAHRLVQRARFGAATVPGLVLADGTRLVGSRRIVRELDARHPEPRLVPAAELERTPVERAEAWGDEVLQPLVRRILWAALARRPGAMMAYTEGARLPLPAPLARAGAPLVARASRRLNHAGDDDVRGDLAHLDGHLGRVEGWIADGTLGGAAPNAADLQIGAGLALLATIADVAPVLDDRPARALAERWFPGYPGATPAGTLPSGWLTNGGH